MSGHTRGPWAWQRFGKEWCLTGQWGMRPIVLSVIRKVGLTSLVDGLLRPFDPTHPDARLIAAAPDLLEALKRYVEEDDTSFEPAATYWRQIKDEALAAITKAEGK